MPHPLIRAYDARTAAGGLERDPAQVAVIERLAGIQEALGCRTSAQGQLGWTQPPEPEPRGVYLWGGVGRGKSMLMDLFMESLDIEAKRRVHFHAFMQEVHRELHDVRRHRADDPVAAATARVTEGVRALALDEMEITDIVDATIVGRVFERMVEAEIVLVVTSNRAPDDLYRDGLKRDLVEPVLRLLGERLDVLHLPDGVDHRRRAPLAEGAFLMPADAKAGATMDAVWRALSQGRNERVALGRAGTIITDGREAARASFAALCGRPVSPRDYLRLAERISVILIDEIPRLSEHQHDEARRFITLIDVLYDAGVGLMASADAPPERLYIDGEGASAFARTASRLSEMLSPRWPGRAALEARLPDGRA